MLREPHAAATESGEVEHVFRRAKCGCQEAIGQLAEMQDNWLSVLAARELSFDVRSKIGLSDLVQETKILICCGFEKFEGDTVTEFRSWVQRILMNRAAHLARLYRGTSKRDIAREMSQSTDVKESPVVSNLLDPNPTPGRLVAVKDDVDKVIRMISDMPQDYQDVITLRSLKQLNLEEVAGQMQRTPDAVRKLWTRAVLCLRDRMKRDEGDE